jgi:hypothetical protein
VCPEKLTSHPKPILISRVADVEAHGKRDQVLRDEAKEKRDSERKLPVCLKLLVFPERLL